MLYYHFVCDKCKIGITVKPSGDMNPYRQLEAMTKWKVEKDGTTFCECCSKDKENK